MTDGITVVIEVDSGMYRERAFERALLYAQKIDESVTFMFNGYQMYVWPGSSAYALEEQYKELVSLGK